MTTQAQELRTIRTRIPARLDRLPWSRFHWMVILGLGTVWILDGLEVTNVGNVGSRWTTKGSGIHITAAGVGTAGTVYIIGACLGALFFGYLTDRFGRKRLFMITLGIYIVSTVATAFAFAPWYLYLCRFVTGAGIGGEYSSINSAIDELIPARVRGRVDLIINGSYWLGSLLGSVASLLFLSLAVFAADFGWRLSFGLGAVLGLAVLLVRRNVPESPRWLFIHGRENEAERIVDEIEHEVESESGEQLPQPDREIAIRQRERVTFVEIARVAFGRYPRMAILGLALFIGQAFLYNGVTFNLGTLFTTFEHVSSGAVPVFTIVYAAGNFMGPLLLGRLFDTVGRKPMVAGTYLGSAVIAAVMAFMFGSGLLGSWGLLAFIAATFFLASSGASAAYLTVSEIFPMETRALAIAFFYAIGTAAGGIAGSQLFGSLINSGNRHQVELAFLIGAAVMAVGGVVELMFGVRAEGRSLEDIATPLTAEEAQDEAGQPEAAQTGDAPEAGSRAAEHPERREALRCRRRAEEARSWAAEHRARIHELRAGADGGADEERIRIEGVLGQIAELQAQAFDERARAHEERADADGAEAGAREAGLQRASAAQERARAADEQAAALGAENDVESERHRELAAAAAERARAREQRASSEAVRGEAQDAEGARAPVLTAEAEMHDSWAQMHDEQAQAAEARAGGDAEAAAEHDRQAQAQQELALAAEERVQAARHRLVAAQAHGLEEQGEALARDRAQAGERERSRVAAEQRIRERLARRERREREGLRRFRPGPGSSFYAPRMVGPGVSRGVAEEALDHEIEAIARAVREHGAVERDELARLVGARYWGPGRFGSALREALVEGRVSRLSSRSFGPARDDAGASGDGAGDAG